MVAVEAEVQALETLYAKADMFHKSGLEVTIYDRSSAYILFVKSPDGVVFIKDYTPIAKKVTHKLKSVSGRKYLEVMIPVFYSASCEEVLHFLNYARDAVEIISEINQLIN